MIVIENENNLNNQRKGKTIAMTIRLMRHNNSHDGDFISIELLSGCRFFRKLLLR